MHCPPVAALLRAHLSLPTQPIFVVELDRSSEGYSIQHVLLEATKQDTVPNIFVKGRHVGGNEDVQRAARLGDLQTMLAARDNYSSPYRL